jgi:RNA polymerase sigma factor (sigma-70 family)
MPRSTLRPRRAEKKNAGGVGIRDMVPTATATDADFATFVAAHGELLRTYAESLVRTSTVDADDALQEGLVKLWREQAAHGLPESPDDRLRYARKVIRSAAVDLIRRKHHTRTAGGDREWVFDLHGVDTLYSDGEGSYSNADVLGVAAALEREASPAVDDQVLSNRILVEALAKLGELEYDVIVRLWGDQRYKEIAAELGVTEAQVNNAAFRARTLLVGLIEHASKIDLDADERDQLVALLNGEIADRKKRAAAQAHLDNCPLCQHVADQERELERVGARIFLPLPALLGLAKPLAAVGGGAAGATAAGAPSSAAASSGGGAIAVAGASGAKLAAVVAVAALVGGGGVAVKAATSHAPAEPRTATIAAAPSSAKTVAAARPVLFTKLSTAAPAKPRPKRKPHKRHVAPKAARAPAPAPQPSPAPAPAPAAPAPAPAPASQPNPAPSSSGSGGEFVLGGGR